MKISVGVSNAQTGGDCHLQSSQTSKARKLRRDLLEMSASSPNPDHLLLPQLTGPCSQSP